MQFARNDSRKQSARFQSLQVRMPYARAKLSIGRENRSNRPAIVNRPPLVAPRFTSCLSCAFASAISSCTSADISAVAVANSWPMLRSAPTGLPSGALIAVSLFSVRLAYVRRVCAGRFRLLYRLVRSCRTVVPIACPARHFRKRVSRGGLLLGEPPVLGGLLLEDAGHAQVVPGSSCS